MRRPLRLVRKISDFEPFGAKALYIGFLVLQASLLHHAEVGILPRRFGDLPSGETEIEGCEVMT
jgi:hypothetical protein